MHPSGKVFIKICLKAIRDTFLQKQPLRGVLRKTCSENMQQIYRRTPISKCDFNKVALQHLLLRTPLGGSFYFYQ